MYKTGSILAALLVVIAGCGSSLERARASRDRGDVDEAARLYQEHLARHPDPDDS